MRALRMLTMAGLLGMAAPTSGGLLDMAAAAPNATDRKASDPRTDNEKWKERPVARALMEIDELLFEGKIDQQEYMRRLREIDEKIAKPIRERNQKKRIDLDADIPELR